MAYEKAQLEYDIIARRQAVFSALFDLIVGRESEYREFKVGKGVHEIIEYRAAEVHDALIPDSTVREVVEQQLKGFSDTKPVRRATCYLPLSNWWLKDPICLLVLNSAKDSRREGR